jgi:hypothetical protein
MREQSQRLGGVIRWMVAGLVLFLAGATWAGSPGELSTDAPSNDPVPRCVVDGGSAQGDQLSVLRTGCDVLAFSKGCAHGFTRPCTSADGDCSSDGNRNLCDEGDRLWLCFGVRC